MSTTNADQVLKKLKKINFPILRLPIEEFQVQAIEKELDSIGSSVEVFKAQMKSMRINNKINE
jgi:glutathione peroxidase-family protein